MHLSIVGRGLLTFNPSTHNLTDTTRDSRLTLRDLKQGPNITSAAEDLEIHTSGLGTPYRHDLSSVCEASEDKPCFWIPQAIQVTMNLDSLGLSRVGVSEN